MSGTKACPHCAEAIRATAFVCPYCGRELADESWKAWLGVGLFVALPLALVLATVGACAG